jgi:hypothetical protein
MTISPLPEKNIAPRHNPDVAGAGTVVQHNTGARDVVVDEGAGVPEDVVGEVAGDADPRLEDVEVAGIVRHLQGQVAERRVGDAVGVVARRAGDGFGGAGQKLRTAFVVSQGRVWR